jgi:Enolase C-terminal domain-like
LRVAVACPALGYRGIKLHAFGDARKDAALCLALREHVGDDLPLMYDGSAGFDLPDAIYLGRALSEAGYLWYEEPIPSRHLCMAISNTTYFESIVTSDPVRRPDEITPDGMLLAPTGPGISLPGTLDLPSPLQPYAEVS